MSTISTNNGHIVAQGQNKGINYRSYCFQHGPNIMFFYYNHNHPIMTKNYKFQLGKVRIFMGGNDVQGQGGRVFVCSITSNPHLNLSLDWNEQYFAKLFHGLARFELQSSGDEHDDTMTLLVRDHFDQAEEIFLLRAKLSEENSYDQTNDFWHTFKNYNQERLRTLQGMVQENGQLARKADEQLVRLVQLQERKQKEKDRLKGQLSALLREKEHKLKQFNDTFRFFKNRQEPEASLDPEGQKETMSIAGSLFQDSQEFLFPS